MPSTSLRASRLTTVAAASGATNWLNKATWKLFDGNTLSSLVQSGATSMGWLFDQTGTLKARPHNLLLQSEALENATWIKAQSTIAAGFQTAPNGTNTARKLVENTTSSVHAVYPENYAITGARLTASVYLKAVERTFVTLEISNFSNGGALCRFNLSNGTAGGTSSTTSDYTGVTAAIENVGNGWYRCSISAFKGAAVNSNNRFVINLDTGTSINYQGDGVSGVLVWGAQLNQGELQPYYRTGTYNLLQFTEAFENAVWVPAGVSVQANVAAGPFGGATADRVVPNTGSLQFRELQQNFNTVAGITYTFSKHLKAGGYRYVQIIGSVAAFGSFAINFDLQTGVETRFSAGSSTVVGRSITRLEDGWFRVSVSVTALSTVSGRMAVNIVPEANSGRGVFWTANGVSGVLFWGAQLVQGSDPLPYEPILGTTPTPAEFFGPRVSYDPAVLSIGPFLLAEEARTNSIRNNTMQGAVAGIPGTVPTNWSISGSGNGLTREILGVFTVNGASNLRLRVSGTATTTAAFSIWAEGTVGAVAASSGQVWTNSLFARVVAGATSGFRMGMQEFDAASAFLRGTELAMSVGSTLTRYAQTVTIGANTASVRAGCFISYTSGQAVDVTLDIALNQLELGATASSPMLTYGTAVTRSADNLSVPNLAATGFNAAEGTLYVDAEEKSDTTSTKLVLSLTDVSNNDIYSLATFNNTFRIRAGNLSSSGIGSTPAGQRFRGALAYSTGSQRGVLNGGAFGTLSQTVAQTPTVIRIGSNQAQNSHWNSRIYQAAIIPTRVPDSGLQRLTRV